MSIPVLPSGRGRVPLYLVASAPLMPLLALQGRGVRRRTPRLPPASGAVSGTVDGPGRPAHVVVVGESTVAGIGAATHSEALTGQLAMALAEVTGRAVTWHAVGKVGATARQAAALVPRVPTVATDLVVLVLGINDVLAFTPPARWAEHLRGLIDDLRTHLDQPVPVLIAGVPPAGRLPALPQPLRGVLGLHARALDTATRQTAESLPHVQHAPTRARVGAADVCRDRFHPSLAGYSAWGRELATPAAGLIHVAP